MKFLLLDSDLETNSYLCRVPKTEVSSGSEVVDDPNPDDPEALVKAYREARKAENPTEILKAEKAVDAYVQKNAKDCLKKGLEPLVRANLCKGNEDLDAVIKEAQKKIENVGEYKLTVDDLKSMVTVYSTLEEKDFIRTRAEEVLENEDLKTFEAHLETIDEDLKKTSYEERREAFEKSFSTTKGVEQTEEKLSPEVEKWETDLLEKEEAAAKENKSLEGFGRSEVAESDAPKEWKDSEALAADKETITKLAEGLDAETKKSVGEFLEKGGKENLNKARALAFAKQGEKLLKGKSDKEVLNVVEKNPDAAFNHFFKSEEGKENTWKVDFKGVDEKLLGLGHFEKNLMAKFQYAKIFNPKTGKTSIGVRGVKKGEEKPGYFDVHSGEYLPIWTGSVVKGLTAKDVSEMDINTKNAFQGEHGKPMSIKDYLAQARSKREAYATAVENGTAKHQIGGENPLNTKLSAQAGKEVVNSKQPKLREAVANLMANKGRYEAVASKHNVPWELLAAIQYREASGNLNKYFLNGQPVGSTTTIVPKGLRFNTWEASADHALSKRDRYGFGNLGLNPSPDSIANVAERYNGVGYKKRGLVSPYAWAGHPAYEKQGGMFVADGKFSRSAHDKRLGVMPIYMELRRQQGKDDDTSAMV